MEKLTATFRIVTPMFIGGADQSPSDGIRPPSVKGALRFWWRALNWGKFITDSKNNNEQQALRALHIKEAELFGSAINGKEGGQGCFLLSIEQPQNIQATQPDWGNGNAGAKYLGYGLFENNPRGALRENQSFKVKLVFKGSIETTIKDALVALGLLGGLGSRNRHGLGSICLESIVTKDNKNSWMKKNNTAGYIQQIQDLLQNKLSAPNPAPFTSFDNKTRVEKLCLANSDLTALNKLGETLMMYRSAGRAGRVLGNHTEQNFKEDHDWKYRSQNKEKRWDDNNLPNNFHPKRVVFGLPHNYGGGNNSVKPESLNRRASPLFMHIHQINENSFIAISIFFPTLFLPNGERISAGGNMVANNINYSVITDFLDGKGGGNGSILNPPRFPNREEICRGSEA